MNPRPGEEIRASIDIGTNSVRVLKADIAAKPPRPIVTDLRITRLGKGLDRTGLISTESAEATVKAVSEFVARVPDVTPVIFGTAALREAKNGPDVARRIFEACGISVRIISGAEEAAITWHGTMMGIEPGPNPMVLDIGGGSTEFILSPNESRSLSLGSVRQTERHSDFEAMRSEIRELVARGIEGFSVKTLYGVAGSVTQVAALELKLVNYDPLRTHGYILDRDVVARWIETLRALTVEERRELPGMVPARAETVIAGAVILHETIDLLKVESVTVSEFDSLWGALVAWD